MPRSRRPFLPACALSLVVASTALAGPPALFDREIRKKGCELLTPKLVAATLGVPEAELKQRAIMGCVYSWTKGGEELQASIINITVSKTVDAAKQHFANATKDQTPEDVQKAVAELNERTDAKEDLSTQRKADAKKVTAAVAASNAGGFHFETVTGVGDEARQSREDGALVVRVHNLQFSVRAYKGPEQPPVSPPKGASFQQLAEEGRRASKAWLEKTLPDRQRDSKKLAEAIVAAL